MIKMNEETESLTGDYTGRACPYWSPYQTQTQKAEIIEDITRALRADIWAYVPVSASVSRQ
jgi:hypothetical protein